MLGSFGAESIVLTVGALGTVGSVRAIIVVVSHVSSSFLSSACGVSCGSGWAGLMGCACCSVATTRTLVGYSLALSASEVGMGDAVIGSVGECLLDSLLGSIMVSGPFSISCYFSTRDRSTSYAFNSNA